MHKQENIIKIFEQAQHDENNKINIATTEAIVKKLGINIYKPMLTQMIRRINRELPPGKQQDSLTAENLVLLVQLLSNQFEKNLWETILDLKDFVKQLQQDLKQRDMSVRDREFQGKFSIKVGPEQQYFNSFKIWLTKKQLKKITVPWLTMDIEAKQIQKRQLLAQALKATYETVMNLIKGEKPEIQGSLNQISFEVNITERGVQVVLQIRNKKMDELQQVGSDLINLVLHTEVDGLIQFDLKTNKDFQHLFDKSKKDHFLSLIQNDCQIILKGSVNKIMTGLKQLLIHSQQFSDLKYDRLYVPGLIAIALTNMQILDGELVFDNIQSSGEMDEGMVEARNQILDAFSEFEGMSEMIQSLGINKILEIIGNTINVEVSFGKYNFGIDMKVKHLKQVIFKLLGLGQDNEGGDRSGSGSGPDNGSDPGSEDS